MKQGRNKEYGIITLYVCAIVLFTLICIFFFLDHHDFLGYIKSFFGVFTPILYGAGIAYMLNRIVQIFERKVFKFLDKKEGKQRLKRILSVISAYISFLAFLAAFLLVLIPQVTAGVSDLVNNIQFYADAVVAWIYGLGDDMSAMRDVFDKLGGYINGFLDGFLQNLWPQIQAFIPKLTGIVGDVVGVLADIVVGIVLSVYFLLQKERILAQIKRFFRAVLPEKKYRQFIKFSHQLDFSFGGYILATAFDSMLVGVFCFVVFAIFGIPYYPLISLIIGVTNFIPFFGPFIGAIPSAFIIFIADPLSVIVFGILILIIQQIDGNVIMPRIVGNHLDITPVWIVIAITIMSGLFGFMGMLIGVPLFAMIFNGVGKMIKSRLARRRLPIEIEAYYADKEAREIEHEREIAESEKECRTTIYDKIGNFIKSRVERIRNKAPRPEEEDMEDTVEITIGGYTKVVPRDTLGQNDGKDDDDEIFPEEKE